jgi:type III pantothenate kinase
VAASAARWLLIGNSRWHWAERRTDGSLRVEHQPPPLRAEGPPPLAWAAVGPLPKGPGLPPSRRLDLGAVPLEGAPPWLGIDRALAGWWAWRRLKTAVLVADCGTVLSLTRVDGEGRFAGGRLQAGLALQLRAMAAGTAGLPPPEPVSDPGTGALRADPWPAATADAMVIGVERGLAAAVAQAAQEAGAAVRLVLTGGDSPRLAALLAQCQRPDQEHAPLLWPDLCLEALVALRPDPGP